jgi:hypothetical protein
MFSEYTITIHKADPPPKKRHGQRDQYPWRILQGGEMFLVHCPPEEAEKVMHSLVASANSWCKNRGMQNQFVCRTLPEGVGAFKLGVDDPPRRDDDDDHN